jgi:hypothetical protein
MKRIPNFGGFINEAKTTDLQTKVIKVSFDIDWNKDIGKVEDEFTLAMSKDSTGVYGVGKDIEKFMGIPEADVVRDVKAGKDKPEDALIYGMCNCMNGGAGIYFWTNGTRLGGYAEEHGIWPAVIEQISHEAGVHLTRLILTRAIAKNKGIDITNEDWIKADYGAGEYSWPAVGDPNDKTPKLIMIDEEAFATAGGLVCQAVTQHFLEMAATYIPQLAAASKI